VVGRASSCRQRACHTTWHRSAPVFICACAHGVVPCEKSIGAVQSVPARCGACTCVVCVVCEGVAPFVSAWDCDRVLLCAGPQGSVFFSVVDLTGGGSEVIADAKAPLTADRSAMRLWVPGCASVHRVWFWFAQGLSPTQLGGKVPAVRTRRQPASHWCVASPRWCCASSLFAVARAVLLP